MTARGRQARQARADERALASADVTLTQHALTRARELGFSCQDVADCVSDPEQSYSSHRSYSGLRRTYQRDDLAAVLEETTRQVVTVLLRRPDRWRHGIDTRRAMQESA